MKEWLTVAEAAVLVGRHPSRIYRWIEDGQLATDTDANGVTVVLAKAVARVESVTRRGRPRGTASKNQTRRTNEVVRNSRNTRD